MTTASEVSEALEIPPATLRRYVSLFGGALSDDAKRPRGRRFSEEDMAVLGRARELFAEGLSTEEVQTELGISVEGTPAEEAGPEAEEPPETDDEEVPATPEEVPPRRRLPSVVETVRVSPQARKAFPRPEQFYVAGERLAERVALAEDRQSRGDERLALLEYRLTRLEEWLRLPWYKRLFGRPPTSGL